MFLTRMTLPAEDAVIGGRMIVMESPAGIEIITVLP
jgi:hypothetical protein